MILMYVVFAILGAGFILYLLQNKGFEYRDLPGFFIAIGNTWLVFIVMLSYIRGLIYIIIFMGYGLVAIPRKLWYAADLKLRYKQL